MFPIKQPEKERNSPFFTRCYSSHETDRAPDRQLDGRFRFNRFLTWRNLDQSHQKLVAGPLKSLELQSKATAPRAAIIHQRVCFSAAVFELRFLPLIQPLTATYCARRLYMGNCVSPVYAKRFYLQASFKHSSYSDPSVWLCGFD